MPTYGGMIKRQFVYSVVIVSDFVDAYDQFTHILQDYFNGAVLLPVK